MVLSFEEALEANTGREIGDYAEFERKRARVLSQSKIIADKLEAQGICTRDEAHDMWAIGELTGCVERLPARYRHIQLIPSVAKADRAAMVRDLTYYLERHARYARYAVITSGQRVPYYGDLRGRRASFHGNIRRWSNEAKERYGVELLYRGDEYTHAEDGAHFHANIVYNPTRRLTPEDWSRFLSWSKKRLGGVVWKDCGRLKDVREVVKYCCKLGEDGIDRLESDRLAWFHRETFRSKVSQPLGSFAAFRKQLEEDGQRIVRIHRPGASYLAKMEKATGSHGGRQNRTGQRGPCENIIVARQLPAPRFSSVFEPVTLVMGYQPVPQTGVGKTGLDIIRERSEQARRWADYNVHTNTPTVQAPVRDAGHYAGTDTAPVSVPRRGGRKKGTPWPLRVIVRREQAIEPMKKRLFHRPDGTTTPMRRVVIR